MNIFLHLNTKVMKAYSWLTLLEVGSALKNWLLNTTPHPHAQKTLTWTSLHDSAIMAAWTLFRAKPSISFFRRTGAWPTCVRRNQLSQAKRSKRSYKTIMNNTASFMKLSSCRKPLVVHVKKTSLLRLAWNKVCNHSHDHKLFVKICGVAAVLKTVTYCQILKMARTMSN